MDEPRGIRIDCVSVCYMGKLYLGAYLLSVCYMGKLYLGAYIKDDDKNDYEKIIKNAEVTAYSITCHLGAFLILGAYIKDDDKNDYEKIIKKQDVQRSPPDPAAM